MNVVLYTAQYGDYDTVKPLPDDLGVQALFYTDSEDTAKRAQEVGWEPRIVPHNVVTLHGDPKITNPMLNHKWWKCHPLEACPPGTDISLWIDGSMTITVDRYVERCLEALGSDDWSCVPHPVRDCVYDEAAFSATLTWRYDSTAMMDQAAYYHSIGFPAHAGLVATGANVRRHTQLVELIGKEWWYEAITRSHQDQLSLPVLFWIHLGDIKWNVNLPWMQWWHLAEHGGV